MFGALDLSLFIKRNSRFLFYLGTINKLRRNRTIEWYSVNDLDEQKTTNDASYAPYYFYASIEQEEVKGSSESHKKRLQEKEEERKRFVEEEKQQRRGAILYQIQDAGAVFILS